MLVGFGWCWLVLVGFVVYGLGFKESGAKARLSYLGGFGWCWLVLG